jgi:hypothetical protein
VLLHDAIVPPPLTMHAYAPHDVLPAAWLQLPAPSQVVLAAVELAHDAEHGVFCAACLHACAVPLQPPGVQIVLLPAGQTPRGSLPPGTSEHVPFDADSAQYWQVPLHAVSQQTPSTQCGLASLPFWQSLLVEHIDPSGFLPHELPLQTLPAEHSVPPDVHEGQQTLVSLQTYGAHVIVVPGLQVPLPSHVESEVTMFVVELHVPA